MSTLRVRHDGEAAASSAFVLPHPMEALPA
jgi:hypothetical protein